MFLLPTVHHLQYCAAEVMTNHTQFYTAKVCTLHDDVIDDIIDDVIDDVINDVIDDVINDVIDDVIDGHALGPKCRCTVINKPRRGRRRSH